MKKDEDFVPENDEDEGGEEKKAVIKNQNKKSADRLILP